MFTPAYWPTGAVTVEPLNPTNCGPTHIAARLTRAKLPAPSETVLPVHPVVLPFPSLPNMETVTPASGVSSESDTTVRPRKDVVGIVTETETLLVWVTGRPSTVAAAVIMRAEIATG